MGEVIALPNAVQWCPRCNSYVLIADTDHADSCKPAPRPAVPSPQAPESQSLTQILRQLTEVQE